MQAAEPQITVEVAKDLGLTESEFQQITKFMGRTPNYTELSIFSAVWSEYCSSKNSIHWLKTLPREGRQLLAGAGEEKVRLVDIGDGWACAFKIVSNNHPSAIEPYQGAAAGAGGTHRDIFTLGARPIAALNSLRFGNIDNMHTRRLMRGVVKGIGDYGNCFGVPTVGGEVSFNDCYNQNILVNAMSAGVVRVGETISARADGQGNPVFIVGSATGKEGIHTAAFATAGPSEYSNEDLPSVRVGDPFQEKLLMEASLEAIQSGVVVGMQNIGAGGIACSTSEMCARSKTGMRIDLDKAPTRQDDMQAFEILISESQERMLIVGKKGEERKLLDIFEKWDLVCKEIGEVTDTGRLEFFYYNELAADVSVNLLAPGGDAPVYQREFKKPEYLNKIVKYKLSHVPKPDSYLEAARKLFSAPNIVSKRWVYEQYDSMVGINSMSTNAPSDAALIRLKGSRKALALAIDCNSAYVFADPYVGAMIAVAEAARNIVCSGGEPLAITSCLNFGNPYNSEAYWQFVMAIKGMGDACRRLNTPVASNNVSFYNQSTFQDKTEPIYPTPTVGMIGILEDISTQTTLDFKTPGHQIYMIGTPHNDLGSSEYLRHVHGIHYSPAPVFDLDEECHIQFNLKKLIQKNFIESAHGLSEGGLFVGLLECAMPRGLGFQAETDGNFRKDAYLFGESQSRILITVAQDTEDDLVNYLNSQNVSFTKIGEVSGTRVIIDEEDFGEIGEWKLIYEDTLSEKMEA
ncbi:MAG: phosphoribosylformylglycinamidine synthase subunit PurL [Lewinellaceae bacterium]|nr:phosphoribosylformylglycinamidine synthase subunit PurL [Lewinellaceae bacterium]